MLDIVKRRYLYFAISLTVIIPGLIALMIWGLPLAIDFSGGSLLFVRFQPGSRPTTQEVLDVYAGFGQTDALAQTSEEDGMIIRSKEIDQATKTQIVAEMEARFGGPISVERFDTVGPSVGVEVAQRAAGAVGLAALGIMIYITYAFRAVPHAARYGVAAIIAMLHDVAVVIGVEAILGHFLGWEVDALFLTALLTVIGFSVHDTIVVFDRIRETSNISRRMPFDHGGQPVDQPDPGALDQHPVNGDDHLAGTGYLWRGNHPSLCGHLAGGRVQRDLFVDLQRRADPGGVGEEGVAHLVPARGAGGGLTPGKINSKTLGRSFPLLTSPHHHCSHS